MKCFSSFLSFLWLRNICSITQFVRFSTYDFFVSYIIFHSLTFCFFLYTFRYLWISSSLFFFVNHYLICFGFFQSIENQYDLSLKIVINVSFINIFILLHLGLLKQRFETFLIIVIYIFLHLYRARLLNKFTYPTLPLLFYVFFLIFGKIK